MPRYRNVDRPVEKKINIKQSVVEQVDAALVDPLTQKPRFGGWSELTTLLLSQWLDGKVEIPIKPFRANLEDLV